VDTDEGSGAARRPGDRQPDPWAGTVDGAGTAEENSPAGRLEPVHRQVAGRRAMVLAGVVIAAAAIGEISTISGTLPSHLQL
jgi:hypothetical protein